MKKMVPPLTLVGAKSGNLPTVLCRSDSSGRLAAGRLSQRDRGDGGVVGHRGLREDSVPPDGR